MNEIKCDVTHIRANVADEWNGAAIVEYTIWRS